MFEDIHVQNTSCVIEMFILEPNNEPDITVELGDVHCTRLYHDTYNTRAEYGGPCLLNLTK